MSELKAISGHEIREDIDYNTRGVDPEDKEWHNYGKELCDTLYYRKSEADKVIAELNAENERLNKELNERIQSAANHPIVIGSLRKELAELREAMRWHNCNEDGTPKEDYEWHGWVLVKFKERDKDFEIIPRVAEFRCSTGKWYPIDIADTEFESWADIFNNELVAVSWREIKQSSSEAPEVTM